MRRSVRALALILLALMLFGMMPFALFAEEADGSETTEPETPSIDTTKPYPEQIADYVASVGGTLWYANDFTGENKTGGNVSSLHGGSLGLGLVPKNDKITVADGVVKVEGALGVADDPFLNFAIPQKQGATIVIEGSFMLSNAIKKVTKSVVDEETGEETTVEVEENVGIPDGVAIMYLSDRTGGKSSDGRLITTKGGKYVTAGSENYLADVKTDNYVNFKVVAVQALNIAYFYVDGKYMCSDILYTGGMNIPVSVAGNNNDKIGFTILRYAHLSGTIAPLGMEAYVDDMYIYLADAPYNVDKTPYNSESYLQTNLLPYLVANSERLIAGTDFEDDRYVQVENGVVVSKDPGENQYLTESGNSIEGKVFYDAYYNILKPETLNNYNHTTWGGSKYTDGTQWQTYSNLHRLGNVMPHVKYTLVTIEKEENGNNYLAYQQANPYSRDSYMDFYASGFYTAGSKFVVTSQFKRFEDSTAAYNGLFNFRYNKFGNGQEGVAADGSTAKRSNESAYFVNTLTTDQYGRVYANDYDVVVNADNTVKATAKKVQVGQLFADEFTTFSLAVDPRANTMSVYVNGKLVHTGYFANPQDFNQFVSNGVTYVYKNKLLEILAPVSVRMQLNEALYNNSSYGGISVDNLFWYTGATPIEAANADTTPLEGWQKSESGYWRYYENGVPALGEKVINGDTYYFERNGAYVSEVERVSLFDLYSVYKGVNGDTMASMAVNRNLLITDVIQGSGKYTYLWADIYKTAAAAGSGNKWADEMIIPFNSVFGNNKYITMNSDYAVTKETSKDYTAWRMKDGKTYYDLTDFSAIEFVAYSNMDINTGWVVILDSDGLSNKSIGYNAGTWQGFGAKIAEGKEHAGEYDILYGAEKAYNYSVTKKQPGLVINEGWNTFTYGMYGILGSSSDQGYFVKGRSGTLAAINNLKFATGWSDACYGVEKMNELQLYFDSFNFIKYVPTTTLPTSGFKTTDEGTLYYEKTSDYATGWKNIDGYDYYFYPYNGLMATGNVAIDGVGYLFDDNGQLIDDTADGFFTVNGIECIFVDGELQTGAFTYDGVSYFANSKGKIWSRVGAIGYDYDKAYTPAVYDGRELDFLMAQNFNNLTAGTFLGSYTDSWNSTGHPYYGSYAGVLKDESLSLAQMILTAKTTHFNVVSEGEGNNALEVTQVGNMVDSYINVNIAFKKTEVEKGKKYTYEYKKPGDQLIDASQNIVLEYDLKLGEDWDADMGLGQLIGYEGTTGSRTFGNDAIRLNKQGYVYLGGDSTKVLCKIDTEVYTNIAITFNQTTYTYDVYINGVRKVDNVSYGKKDGWVITELRTFHYGSGHDHGSLFIDNFYVYIGETPSLYDPEYVSPKVQNGWTVEGGVQRYYVDGLMRMSAIEAEGPDGVVRYYEFDSLNGSLVGTANGFVGGKFYRDGELVTNDWVEDEKGRYYVDANSAPLKGSNVIDGKLYYFNTSTGVLERGEVFEDVVTLIDIDRILKSNANLVADYSNLRDGLMYTAKAKDGNTTYNIAGIESTDISGYDFIAVDFWLGGSYKGEFLVLYGETETLFKLDVTENEDGTLTYTKPADGFSIYLKDRNTLSGTWKNTGKKDIGGMGNTALWTRTLEDGTVEYYGRRWNYSSFKYKFENFQPGWNTIYIPVSSLGGHAKNATQIGFTTSGWEMNPAGSEFDKNWKNYTYSFGEVNAIKLAGYGTENLDGWVDGKLYLDSNQFATGWAEYDDCTYFLDETGVAYTGKKIVDGILYEFDGNGVLIGAVTGKETVIGGSQVYDADEEVTNWVTYEIERIYIDGYYQVGKTTLNGVMYICGEDGAIIKGQTLIVDGYLYEIDETGVATAQTKTWYTDEAGNIYYAGSGGKLTVNSSTKIDGYFYAFDENGVMIKNSFFVVNATNGSKRYFDGEGKGVLGMYDKVIVGYSEDGTALYKTAYFNTSSGLMVVPAEGTDTIVADGVTYVCDAEGFVKYESHEHIYDNACDASCSICGELREVTGHQYDAVVTAPTCTEGGYTTYTCTVCGYTYTADETEATGEHTYGEGVVTAPTCTEGGYTTYTCTVCGDTYTADETEATGHVYDNACDTDCNICGEVREITHSYDAVVTAPTCTEGGYTTYTCTVCGDTYTADETAATGEHTYGEGVVTAPTCAAGGYTTYTCTVCGDTYTADETAATGEHTYDDAMDAECNVCGETREVEELIATGKCGVDAIWKLRPDGTLVIAGTGCMFDYAGTTDQPWQSYKAQITKIVVEEGILSIARCAFYGHTAVTEVELPESLMVIEEYAFFGCTEIKSMHIPANTFYIGIYGLRKVWLENLTFGNPEGWAFFDGTEVTAENAIYNLTEDPIYYKQACLRDFDDEGEIMASGTFGDNEQFSWSITDTGRLVINGEGDMPRFNINTTPWYAYRGVIREVVIGEGITSVGRCAFHTSRSVRSISLPSTLVRIDEYAFYNMPYIKSAIIPASVEKIEIFAFRKCYELKNVTMECIFGWSAGDEKVSASALNVGAADMLTTISYTQVWVRDVNAEEEILDPNYIAGGACNVYTKWTLTYIDEAKTQIKLTITGNGAMPQFDKSSLPWLEHIASIVEIEVCEGVTEVGYCAFYGMSSVTKVTLPEGLVKINGYSFYNCWALESIAIPSTVESIGAQAFKCGITSAEFACRTGWTINGNVIPTDEMADPAIAASHLYNDRSYEFTRDPATVEEAPNNGWYDGKYYIDGAMVTDTAMYIGEDYYVFDAEGNYEIVANDGGHTANY